MDRFFPSWSKERSKCTLWAPPKQSFQIPFNNSVSTWLDSRSVSCFCNKILEVTCWVLGLPTPLVSLFPFCQFLLWNRKVRDSTHPQSFPTPYKIMLIDFTVCKAVVSFYIFCTSRYFLDDFTFLSGGEKVSMMIAKLL